MTLSQTLRELAGKATRGPWHGTALDQCVQIYSDSFDYLGETRDYHGDDAALIVALRNNLPTILAALETAEDVARIIADNVSGTTFRDVELQVLHREDQKRAARKVVAAMKGPTQ